MKILKSSLIIFFICIINTYADDIYLSCESTTKLRTSFIINDEKEVLILDGVKREVVEWKKEFITFWKSETIKEISEPRNFKPDEVTINDVPDPKDCLIEKINHFALTFNAYEDNKIEKEFNSNESNFYDQYFNEGKFKDSLKYLRAILFYTQRGEHMSGPSVDYDQRMRQIIKDIRSLLNSNS